jgi:hypothetical protein
MYRSTRRSIAPLALLVLALGCADPALDSSRWESSVETVRSSVDESRRADFDFALETVRSASAGEIEGTTPFSLDGMTAEAVFAEAERIELRRDLAWVEREIQAERQVVDARTYLERLDIHDFRTVSGENDQVLAVFEVANGLASSVETAWIRIEAELPDGDRLGGEDIVDFRPGLEPGERREVRIPVSGDARLALPPDPGTTVAARFTLVERGGEIVAQEPSPATLAEAERRLADAEQRARALRDRLSG